MIKFTNTNLSLSRNITSYSKIQWAMGQILRNKRWQTRTNRIKSLKYLNIGCGSNIHNNFINLDYCWKPGIDLCWDLKKDLPFEDGSLEGIFSEHCLEHIFLQNTISLLTEFKRVLAAGGLVRISIPDGELYLNIYAQRHQKEDSANKPDKFPYEDTDKCKGIYSPIMSVNRIAKDHGHLYLYDYDLLQTILTQVGFVDVTRTNFGQGHNQNMLIDSEHRAIESLYIEAISK